MAVSDTLYVTVAAVSTYIYIDVPGIYDMSQYQSRLGNVITVWFWLSDLKRKLYFHPGLESTQEELSWLTTPTPEVSVNTPLHTCYAMNRLWNI